MTKPIDDQDDQLVRLADGTTAHIRPLRADDREQVRALYEASSEWDRYLRFFSPTTVEGAMRLTPPPEDDDEHCLLAAEVAGRIVGLGQYDVTEDGDVAEVAFMVDAAHQGRGVATLLLEALAPRAARRGIRRFRALFLRENQHMPDVFAHAGFDIRWSCEDLGVAAAEFDLAPVPAWVDEHERRERLAQAHSIGRLLRPRSIAVIGAGSGARSIGRAIVENLVEGGFTGVVHPVNRRGVEVAGRATVASVLDIEGPVDLAVVAVPAGQVVEVARQCATKGVWGIVVISGGFAELPEGAALQAELLSLCRAAGMRLVGPNCVGVINTGRSVSMNATFSPVAPAPGRVGVASQSGGVGIELLARAHQLDLGISSFVSLGNKADVSTNDLLQYWAQDDATDVVLLYLESFGNPGKFARIMRRLTREKPVVVLKSGRSAAGARGALSHTAALADSDAAVDALLRHTGVIRVDTLAELFDVASLLMHQPVPAGRRVAVMSNGGGPAIVAADACVAAGLEVPELSAELQRALQQLAPTGGVKNPVDLIAAADADVFERATRLVLESGEVDALVVIYVAPYVTRADEIEGAIARAEHDATHDVALAACFLGLQEHRSITPVASGDRTVPVFAYPESAARALAHAAELGAWRRRPTSAVAEPEVDLSAARARVADALERSFEDGWMPLDVAAAFLDDYGVPMMQSVTVHSSEAAVEAARRIGYPVALKAMAPGLVHKADVGGVRLGLVDDVDLVEAYEHMTASVGPAMFGATVQSMVDAGVELIVGIHHDPTFGPLVLFGAGGFAADLDHDAVLLVPPFTDADIDEAIRSLRRSPLLFGYRSSPQVDVDALHDLLARVGRLASDIPEIAELDCNPVIATPAGAVVVDAKVRLVRRPDHPNPFDPD